MTATLAPALLVALLAAGSWAAVVPTPSSAPAAPAAPAVPAVPAVPAAPVVPAAAPAAVPAAPVEPAMAKKDSTPKPGPPASPPPSPPSSTSAPPPAVLPEAADKKTAPMLAAPPAPATEKSKDKNKGNIGVEVLPPLLPNCSADQDCVKSLGRHSACRDFWCACTDEAQYDAGFSKTCLLTRRAVGESCKENGDCRGVANSYCKAGSCHCDAGFVFSDDASKCLPVSTSASPACEEHRQCVILLQSPAGPTGPAVCVGGRCRCRYDHEHVNGTCVLKKERGKGCSADAECVDLEGGACVQGVCACREGFAPDVAANKCLPVLRSPGAACTEDIQCSEGLGDLGHCSAGACACVDGAALSADNKCACAAGEEPRGGRCERTAPGKQQPVKQEGGKGSAAALRAPVIAALLAALSITVLAL